MLVVGPNPTFMEYVSHVLPTLGEESVEQRAVGELVDGVEATIVDPPEVERLKGDVRLAEVLARAAEARSAVRPEELVARMEGEYVRVRERDVRELIERAREELGLTAHARERFRMDVLRRFYEDYGTRLGGLAWRDFAEVERSLNAKGFLPRWLDRVWPVAAPEALVRSLLTTPARLAEAAEGILDEPAQRLLRRPRSGFAWGDHDVPLVDEARALLAAPPRAFGHVIVDEAQDLTPMQLRMVARRARAGSITILGDIAQATGPVVHDRWDEVVAYLDAADTAEVAELRHAYRVPAEIMELALPLLDVVAPDVAPPVAFRTGAGDADRAGRRGRPRDRRSPGGARARDRGGPPRGDPPGQPDPGPQRALRVRRWHPAALAAPGEGARVRPRRGRRAGADRGGRDGPSRALCGADPADEDTRRRHSRPLPDELATRRSG